MDSLEKTKKRALKILGSRNFSEQEMIKRLTSKGETPEDAETAVKWLVGLGYIDDSNYATLIVNHYAARGYGEARIRDELYKRGIPRLMWDEKIAELENADLNDPAFSFLEKKLRGSDDKDDLRRAKDALIRRGFSYEEAAAAIGRYLEALEE
ncbi:MAG: recombination regulator RecX [Oscillospiraceae bacterium]|nr:recombination regulator RecX [Oscillospiraceae bacterium]